MNKEVLNILMKSFKVDEGGFFCQICWKKLIIYPENEEQVLEHVRSAQHQQYVHKLANSVLELYPTLLERIHLEERKKQKIHLFDLAAIEKIEKKHQQKYLKAAKIVKEISSYLIEKISNLNLFQDNEKKWPKNTKNYYISIIKRFCQYLINQKIDCFDQNDVLEYVLKNNQKEVESVLVALLASFGHKMDQNQLSKIRRERKYLDKKGEGLLLERFKEDLKNYGQSQIAIMIDLIMELDIGVTTIEELKFSDILLPNRTYTDQFGKTKPIFLSQTLKEQIIQQMKKMKANENCCILGPSFKSITYHLKATSQKIIIEENQNEEDKEYVSFVHKFQFKNLRRIKQRILLEQTLKINSPQEGQSVKGEDVEINLSVDGEENELRSQEQSYPSLQKPFQ